MKKRISESKIGIEYLSDVIATCDQNGIECIVDDKTGDIYYYDPKRRKYGDDKLLHDNDVSIWDIVEDKELFDAILFDATGAIFKDFAVRWNDLQKKSDGDEVYKTQICRPIRGNFTEGNQIDSAIVYWKDSRIKPYIIYQVHSIIEALYVLDGMIDNEPEGDFPEVDHIRIGNKDYDQAAIEQYRADLDDMVYDESGDSEDDVVEKIPNWATTYIMYGDVPDNLTDEDIQMVDDFIDKLASQGISLISPIEGTESEFEPHPAFGDACDTTDWSCETSID